MFFSQAGRVKVKYQRTGMSQMLLLDDFQERRSCNMGLIIVCLFLSMMRSTSLTAQTTFDPASLSGGASFHLFFFLFLVFKLNNRFLLPIEKITTTATTPDPEPNSEEEGPFHAPFHLRIGSYRGDIDLLYSQ